MPFGADLLAFTAVVHFGRRRFNTLEVMSGSGDERVRSLYTRAVAIAGTVMSFVLPGWWLVTVAQGEANDTLAVLCAIFGATFVVAVAELARRSWARGPGWHQFVRSTQYPGNSKLLEFKPRPAR